MNRTAVLTMFLTPLTWATPVVDPFYAGSYSLLSLGSPQVPPQLGGLTVPAGAPGTLLIGGRANTPAADIFAVPLARDANNHITGFAGPGEFFADANGNANGGIDAGLTHGPGGVLFYTSFSDNSIGQIKPGSTGPDKLIDLDTIPGYAGSVGSLQFIPDGFPNAGQIAIASFNSDRYHRATLTPDGSGTFDISGPLSDVPLSGRLEGILFVPLGSPLFPKPSILVAEFVTGRISSYEMDANGDPIAASRRDFITGLTGAEGAALDPLTNDALFSAFGANNEVFRVTGFATPPGAPAVPEPGTMVLIGVGVIGIGIIRKRERGRRVSGRVCSRETCDLARSWSGLWA